MPVYDDPQHIDAAAKAFVHYNAPMFEPMTAGRYPEKWLAGMGGDAPKVEAGDLELIASPCDFIGLNVYRGVFVCSPGSAEHALAADYSGVENVVVPVAVAPPNLALPATPADGFIEIPFPPGYPAACAGSIKIVPQAIYWGIRHLHELYGYRKSYITENGCAVEDQPVGGHVFDIDRLQYYRQYLQSAQKATGEKYPLKGYFAWSFMDNFEWSQGCSQRFGLCRVDFQTLARTPKWSARYYAACIRSRRPM